MIQIQYPWVGIFCFASVCLLAWLKRQHPTVVSYRFSFASLWADEAACHTGWLTWRYTLLWALRWGALLFLVLAVSRPTTPDARTEVPIEGVSIMLALDVSRSMCCFDDIQNPKARFTIAQEEAIAFIERRTHDVCGLVIFGAIAATRCPLTADRRMLMELIRTTRIGDLNDEGTALAQAIIMGVKRLAASKTVSKVLVLLTDGEPSPDDTPYMAQALELARKCHIKIYTIGIGSLGGGYIQHPLGGLMQVASRFHREVLLYIAEQTGGAAFEASNQKELERIYQTIDALEKTTQHAPIYAHHHEWYVPCLLGAATLLLIELIMRFLWVLL